MKITKMLLLEVGTFNDMYQRPYTAHTDGIQIQQLQEATNGGLNLTPGALGQVGADIMRLSSTVHGNVHIPNSFDSPRLCFMMEVEFPGTGGLVHVEWLMGYTDYIGVSDRFGTGNSVHFDPAMRLYFNNVVQGRKVASANAFGNAHHSKVSGTYQLINGDYRPQIDTLHQAPHLMRPQDVFTSMSMQGSRQLLGREEVLDIRATHGPERVAVSNRRNTIPGHYLSAWLTTWQSEMENTADNDPSVINSHMAGKVAEPTISRIRTLGSLSVASELRVGGSVTWGELAHAEGTGTLEDRAVVVLAQSARHRSSLAQRGGNSANWNGNSHHQIMAAGFIQAIPGMMMNLMLTELSFSVTNKTLDGSWQVMFTAVQSFNDGDNIAQVQAFENRLCWELMPGLTHGGLIPTEIHAQFSVTGQTFVEIDLDDGDGFIPFMAPSFCDGLYSSVRAPDADTLDNFADRLSRITSSLEQDRFAGGAGYEPHSPQFSTLFTSGNKYENSGSL